MIILGIVGGFHDPAACLLADGKVVAVAEEERFTGVKHDYGSFPDNAADYCLREAGLLWMDVDAVAYPFDHEFLIKSNLEVEPWRSEFARDRLPMLRFKEYFGSILLRVKTWCAQRGLPEPVFVDHHASHLAGALYGSDFDRAALLSIDSRGELHSTVTAVGEGDKISELNRIALPHSLGMLYTGVTGFLGYRPYDGEGTVMGLAPYGEDRYPELFNKIAWEKNGGFECEPGYLWNSRTDGFLSNPDPLAEHFGEARPYRPDPRNGADEHIACSLQARLTAIVKSMAHNLIESVGCRKLCIAGGVGLNSKLNGELYELDCVDELYVFPLANDAGCAVGAAYHVYKERTGRRPEPLRHVFLGPGFSDSEARLAAESSGHALSEPADMAGEVANLLAEGKVVGWVQGRMEAGPRALGGRSIMADPSRIEIKDAVNERVKRREPWRPFAATIADTHAAQYLESPGDARFMITCYRVKAEARERLAGASHIDGTNRAQVIGRDENPLYYDVVTKFGEKTGTYGVLNTSFNLKGKPIVRTPADAVEVFESSGMDALAVRRYLLVKS